jgi:hypothetical protein
MDRTTRPLTLLVILSTALLVGQAQAQPSLFAPLVIMQMKRGAPKWRPLAGARIPRVAISCQSIARTASVQPG